MPAGVRIFLGRAGVRVLLCGPWVFGCCPRGPQGFFYVFFLKLAGVWVLSRPGSFSHVAPGAGRCAYMFFRGPAGVRVSLWDPQVFGCGSCAPHVTVRVFFF